MVRYLCIVEREVGWGEMEICPPSISPLCTQLCHLLPFIEKCCTFMSTLCFCFQFPAWWFISCLFALCPLSFVLCPLPSCLVQLAKFKLLLMMIMHVCFYYFSEEPFPGNVESVRMGEDVLATLAGAGSLYAFKSTSFWSSIKNAG